MPGLFSPWSDPRPPTAAARPSSSPRVCVGSFEGPFDLLLTLIARRKVDVYEIPIAQITDDYLAVLRQMEQVDLDVTTEFLVVAATLVELKAARLLPGEEDPELEELACEARDLLYARLLDYRTFREAAGYLRQRLNAYAGYAPREVALEERYAGLRADFTMPIGADELAALAARALAEQRDASVDVSHLQPVRMTVGQAAGMMVDELNRAGGQATFAELTAGCRHRIEVIVYFLAVLELFKLEHVDLSQAANFGSLTVSVSTDSDWAGSEVAAMRVREITDGYDGTPAAQDADSEAGVSDR